MAKCPGLGRSKLGLDNPGLVWNRISALEAFKENSVEFFLAIKQRSIETQIKI